MTAHLRTSTAREARTTAPALPPDGFETVTHVMVLAAVGLAGFDLRLAAGVTATLLIVAATAPMWWREVADTEFAVAIIVLSVLAIVSGLYLAELSSADHVVSRAVQQASIVHLLGGLAIMIALLWGRALFPLHVLAAVYGTGALADAILYSQRSWKYNLALPVAIITVGWLGKYRSRIPAVAALLGVGFLAVLDDGRSFFAFCALAACLVLWQARPVDADRKTSRWYPAIVLAGVGAAMYGLATSLLTGGYFGVAIQQRTIAQINTSGSLIAGGRPEWAATRALATEHPWGYGLGVVPDANDYAIAKSGLDSINVDAGGYLTNYMLGGQFRLHSITSDLWITYGIVGVALALTIAFALVRTLSTLSAERRCPPIVAFAVILAIWDLAFGPIYSNWPDVCFALGVTLMPRPPAAGDVVTGSATRASNGADRRAYDS